MVEPSKGTFNHPSPRQYFPFVRFDFLGDIDFKSKLFLEFPDKGAAIPCIGAEFFERGVAQTGQCRYRQSGLVPAHGVAAEASALGAYCLAISSIHPRAGARSLLAAQSASHITSKNDRFCKRHV